MNSPGITSVPGIRVGHYTDRLHATGCTVVLSEDGAVGGVDVRGSAPGTRETDLLSPTAMVDRVHAVLLSGGSAFGLSAATGVVEYLEENDIGIEFGNATIPIVPAAILFDLGLVTHKVRPDADAGRRACEAASAGTIAEGSVGAGTGATVAKLLGRDRCLKGGIGTASVHLGDGLTVGAIVAVNAVGGVVDPETSDIVAGPLADDGITMLDSMKLITDPGYEEAQDAVRGEHHDRRGRDQREPDEGSGQQAGGGRTRRAGVDSQTGAPDERRRHPVRAVNTPTQRSGKHEPAVRRRGSVRE